MSKNDYRINSMMKTTIKEMLLNAITTENRMKRDILIICAESTPNKKIISFKDCVSHNTISEIDYIDRDKKFFIETKNNYEPFHITICEILSNKYPQFLVEGECNGKFYSNEKLKKML